MDCHLVVVGELKCFHDPVSYVSWDLHIPSRFNHAGHIGG